MQEFLAQHYIWFKAVHILAVISWMAAMLYLPRLFVYHASAKIGSELSETLKIMEYRLLRYICNPAMIVAWILGLLMLYANPDLLSNGWVHTKLLLVVILSGVHGVLSKHRRMFAQDKNTKTATYFRILNEIPTVLMIGIVLLAVAKPF